MKKILFFTFAICLLTFTSSFADIPREYFHKQYEAFGITPSRADSVHSFDALSYEINLQLFPSNHYILGNVLARIMAKEDNLTEISYELEQLNVDSVLVNGNSASFSYDDEIVTITLDQSYNIGDTLSTQVFYQGYPTLSSDVYHTGIYWQNYIFTYSDPNGARFWWPCYDHPWDKATTKMNIRVPDNMLVASNGILVDEIDHGDGTKTFCWDNADQIATYLVSFCAGDYATFEQDYGDLPIINYVYPSHLNAAQSDFACIPTAMGIYENLYGNYPFQKYGMAECGIFGGWGGMEHQTMTSIGNGLINGMGTYELIFVHELAHQWFGDCLTPLTWKDVWLSEGFATYSEALYVEATEGFDAMCDYVESSFHQYYLNWAGGNAYTVYDPPYNAYFTPATYEKPASVLHMLRLMVGDSTFFDILQSYFDTYKYGNVITTDFIDVCESVSGMDLQEFFNDWIFGSGVPRFEYYYLKAAIGDGTIPAVIIRTRSLSDTDTHFEMQVPFSVNINGEIDSVLADAGAEEFESTTCSWLPEWPVYVSLQFDPHHWILDRGSTEIRPILDAAYPADGQVVLYWEEFPDTTLFPYWTYKVYRRSEAQPQYEEIQPVYLNETSCVDTTVVNGVTYDYVITVYYSDLFWNHWETGYSNSMSATPMAFPMDNGILLVDETKDGSGGPVDPVDTLVDSFYHWALQNYSLTDYDYAESGAPELEQIRNYSTVIWHDDDYNEHLIGENIAPLASLLISGGNVVISGWKTADYLPPFFLNNFLATDGVQIISTPDFLGAFGEDNYPYIDVNGDFVPPWNDRWAYVATFEDAQAENVLYRYDSFSGDNDSLAVGLVNSIEAKNLVVLGFPLYFMQPDDVKAFYEKILPEFGENMGIYEPPQSYTELTLYQNFPNPFSTSTTISFSIPPHYTDDAEIEIYNIRGQRIRELKIENLKLKINKVVWDGKDDYGKQLPSGIYFAKLSIGEESVVKKMLLLR